MLEKKRTIQAVIAPSADNSSSPRPSLSGKAAWGVLAYRDVSETSQGRETVLL